jgi:hypothetical protein
MAANDLIFRFIQFKKRETTLNCEVGSVCIGAA